MLLKEDDIKAVVQFADVVHGDVAALALLVELAHRVLGRDLTVLACSEVDTNLRISIKRNVPYFYQTNLTPTSHITCTEGP